MLNISYNLTIRTSKIASKIKSNSKKSVVHAMNSANLSAEKMFDIDKTNGIEGDEKGLMDKII